ncbi:hypothetical protein CARUB_v10000436mg [Capsella rubella]|uniref:GYF domain-containing protein n=1 Tax=Capsella rubella TaxID=81985 RepID=R0FE45_9BRAS|nr:hypothetical protein CARUB_v10000436mg [Capsella rubella]
MEDSNGKVKISGRKRLRKPKTLEFVGWGSRNLIEFLQSLGRDTTNKISENDVTAIIMSYIRQKNRETPSKKKRKLVACDEKLRLLFGTPRINIIKVPDLVEKHYLDYQDDSDFDFLYASEDDKQQRPSPSDKVAKRAKQVVQKPKGTFAAIVSDNVKLLYLRKSLIQELAKTPETFESKVVGAFVRIKNPCQLVHVTGVKEGNPIDGNLLQVTNYSYYLEDVATSSLSDDDFSQDECEEFRQRIKNGFAKRPTVVDMEEKARSLHEDYLERRELLENPEEQLRLLHEVPEVVAEELEPERVDDDRNIENDLTVPNPEAFTEAHQSVEEKQPSDSLVSSVQKTLENSELLKNSEDQFRLFREVPEFVVEELDPENVDDDENRENDFIVPKPDAATEVNQSDEDKQVSYSPDSSVQKTLENSELLENSEDHLRLSPEVPEVAVEELDPEYIDDDEKIENDFTVPKHDASTGADQSEEEKQLSDSPDSGIQTTLEVLKLGDKEDQPICTASEGNKDLHEDVFEPPENCITQNKDCLPEGEINRKVTQQQSSIPVIDLSNLPEIIELSSDDDDDDDKDNQAYQNYDPKKVMWFYELPKGKTHGPFSLTQLKEWYDEEYFDEVPDFKVWRTGESAVLVAKLLPYIKT